MGPVFSTLLSTHHDCVISLDQFSLNPDELLMLGGFFFYWWVNHLRWISSFPELPMNSPAFVRCQYNFRLLQQGDIRLTWLGDPDGLTSSRMLNSTGMVTFLSRFQLQSEKVCASNCAVGNPTGRIYPRFIMLGKNLTLILQWKFNTASLEVKTKISTTATEIHQKLEFRDRR